VACRDKTALVVAEKFLPTIHAAAKVQREPAVPEREWLTLFDLISPADE
jgi:hypothetical protein